jgi:polyphosphate kinase
MHRNLDRRVETLVRVKDPAVQAEIDALLGRLLAPDVRHWELQSDGCWLRRPDGDAPARDVQQELIERAGARAHG